MKEFNKNPFAKNTKVIPFSNGTEARIMKTVLQDLIQWTIENAFNVEGQDGTKYIAIDFEEMRQHFEKWLEQEKKQITMAYFSGLNNSETAKAENSELYCDCVFPKPKETSDGGCVCKKCDRKI